MYIFKYIGIYGAKPIIGTGHQLMTRSWMVCYYIGFDNFLWTCTKTFTPHGDLSSHDISSLKMKAFFPLITKKYNLNQF